MPSTTYYAALVEAAKQKRSLDSRRRLLDALASDSATTSVVAHEVVARALDGINKFISIDPSEFSEASRHYNELADTLVVELDWAEEAISVKPQGSTSTITLIRSPNASKFDIDAVCIVDISKIEAQDPMAFFDAVGTALEVYSPEAKKRCWRIDFKGSRYYIDFTPSVPLDTIPQQSLAGIRYRPTERYRGTALAVVDTPTGKWKTSNPEGFSTWVEDQAKRPILRSLILARAQQEVFAGDGVTPVPEQIVPLSDTLRIAIRLCKRHRDMSVRRGFIESEHKPLSVIIVTLLTQCYEGLADQGAQYTDPIALLIDLAELMPGMVEIRNGEFWISNPTVEGENFAERWNENAVLKRTFDAWCGMLVEDLTMILSAPDELSLAERLIKVFGCTGASDRVSPLPTGLTSRTPNRVHTPPPTLGLA